MKLNNMLRDQTGKILYERMNIFQTIGHQISVENNIYGTNGIAVTAFHINPIITESVDKNTVFRNSYA